MGAYTILRLAVQGSVAAALIVALSVGSAHAQSGASTGLAGRVTDSTGGGVPGVSVTISNVDTGSDRVVTTDATGNWEARFLLPGNYRVRFELSGFRPVRRDGL